MGQQDAFDAIMRELTDIKQQGKRWVGVDPEEWIIGPNGLERSDGDQAVKVARTI